MFLLAALILWPVSAFPGTTAGIDKPLAQVEKKIVDARDSGQISADDYDRLRAQAESIQIMKEEAVADGRLNATQRETLKKSIRTLEAGLAQALGNRTAPPEPAGSPL